MGRLFFVFPHMCNKVLFDREKSFYSEIILLQSYFFHKFSFQRFKILLSMIYPSARHIVHPDKWSSSFLHNDKFILKLKQCIYSGSNDFFHSGNLRRHLFCDLFDYPSSETFRLCTPIFLWKFSFHSTFRGVGSISRNLYLFHSVSNLFLYPSCNICF